MLEIENKSEYKGQSDFVELNYFTANYFRYSSGKNANIPCDFGQVYHIILYQRAGYNAPCLANKPPATP